MYISTKDKQFASGCDKRIMTAFEIIKRFFNKNHTNDEHRKNNFVLKNVGKKKITQIKFHRYMAKEGCLDNSSQTR